MEQTCSKCGKPIVYANAPNQGAAPYGANHCVGLTFCFRERKPKTTDYVTELKDADAAITPF